MLSPDGQSWPLILSSLNSLPFTNRPLIVRQPGPQLMSKAPFSGGWIVLIKHAHTRSVADRDGAGTADVAATAAVTFPITRSWVSLQRLAQSSIQSLPLTDAHLACRWTGEKKKTSQCVSALAWESLGIPGLVTSLYWG